MFGSDDSGRASFAVLALAALLLANFSVVYLFRVQQESVELTNQASEIRVMREFSDLTHKEVRLAAHYLAMDSIRNSTRGPHNNSGINHLFSMSFSRFVKAFFPRETRGFRISVDSYAIIVLTQTKNTEDVVKTGTIPENADADPDSTAIRTGEPGELEDVERVAYFRLSGCVNYTISKGQTVLKTRGDVDSELDSPFPFMEQQLQRFSSIGLGPSSEMGRVLRYILTTVAQMRVLQGFAGGKYGKTGMTTTDVVTARDVEIAVNLALVLEQLKHFRSVDESTVAKFDLAYSPGDESESNATSSPLAETRTLSRLLISYAGNGTIDPADVFALFTAMDEDELRMNKILAQALHAMFDQFVLKYLDYLDVLPLKFLANLGLSLVELAKEKLTGLFEWLAKKSGEAQLVRQFVWNLFGDLGYSLLVAGPALISIPEQEFVVANANGTRHEVSLTAMSVKIQFATQVLTEGHDDIWRNYYDKLFKSDLEKIHSGVANLARDIADKMANQLEMAGLFKPIELNGRINPRDRTGVLEYVKNQVVASLDSALDMARNDPRFLEDLLQNLWDAEKSMIGGLMDYIEQKYIIIVDSASHIAQAKNTIVDSMKTAASFDPDFRLLDSVGSKDLSSQMSDAVDVNEWAIAAYNQIMFRDFAAFESLYDKATSLDTPPELGGMYRRMVTAAVGAKGFLLLAGDFVKSFLQELMANDEVSIGKTLFPAYTQPFRFYHSGNSSIDESDEVLEESFVVSQTPSLLAVSILTSEGGDLSGIPLVGQLWVDIVDPSSVRATRGSPNVHYTEFGNVSGRPFETQWNVTIKGAVEILISTSRAVYLDAGGYAPATDEIIVQLDAEVPIRTFSGWPLDGVDYVCSSTFTEDLWKLVREFLDKAWKAVATVFKWILECTEVLTNQLSHLVDFLESLASKALKTVYDVINRVTALVYEIVKCAVKWFAEAMGFILSLGSRKDFNIQAFGLSIHVTVNGPEGKRVSLEVARTSFEFVVSFVNLNEAMVTPREEWIDWDVLGSWHGKRGKLSIDGKLDALMAVEDRIVRVKANQENGWNLDLVIPEIEAYYDVSFAIPVPIPIGPVEVEFEVGFRLRLSENLELVDPSEILGRSLRETTDLCGGLPLTPGELREFIATLVGSVRDNFLGELERQLSKVIDVSFYVQGSVKAAGVIGIGGRFAWVMDGNALRAFFSWLEGNVRILMDKLLHLLFNSDPEPTMTVVPISLDAISGLFAFGGVIVTVGPPSIFLLLIPSGLKPEIVFHFCLGVNIPFIGWLTHDDWGPWEIRFGALFESIPFYIAGPSLGTGLKSVDLWLFKGTLTPA